MLQEIVARQSPSGGSRPVPIGSRFIGVEHYGFHYTLHASRTLGDRGGGEPMPTTLATHNPTRHREEVSVPSATNNAAGGGLARPISVLASSRGVGANLECYRARRRGRARDHDLPRGA
jgi:hypothetical protein